jgi:two-component system, LytTR family, response regulator
VKEEKMRRQYRAFIVDDERHAREDLCRELAVHPEIEIIGEAESIDEAARLIPSLKPDVVFLDIQMPKDSGFKLFDRVEVNFKVVFVTAFDNYAIRAFEVNALDYLLKPIRPERLTQTIARLSEKKNDRAPSKKSLNHDDYVFIQSQGRTGFLRVNSIACIRVAGDYTELCIAKGERRSVLKSMNEWEEELPKQYFLRIHRSTIINLEYVERADPEPGGIYKVYLRGISEPFTTSHRRASELRRRI